jgi:DNA helicase-2/ATP-dependent DNA helicase PcrA
MLHGQTRYNVKSRFFDELPEESLKWLTPRNQGFGSGFAREYQQAWERGSGLKGMVGAGRVAPSGQRAAWVEPPVPATMKQKVSEEHGGLRVGKGVFHTKFGEGVLLTLEGSGADARAQVNFGRHGTKWLALSVAKLTPID